MGEHLIDGEFQSDKYPTTPRGKVPLSVKDRVAQPLLWWYAMHHRAIDPAFSDDLQAALRVAGYEPPQGEPDYPALKGQLWTWDEWAEEPGYDSDTGAPSLHQLCAAISVWASGQSQADRRCDVAAAAQAFNISPERVIEAVETGIHFVYLSYKDGEKSAFDKIEIEHDGE